MLEGRQRHHQWMKRSTFPDAYEHSHFLSKLFILSE